MQLTADSTAGCCRGCLLEGATLRCVLTREELRQDGLTSGVPCAECGHLLGLHPTNQVGLPPAAAPHGSRNQVVAFDRRTTKKVTLPLGKLAEALGGVKARQATVAQLMEGFRLLASVRGRDNLDKREVPLLAIGNIPQSGKTEFLRWVFNNCCSLCDGAKAASTLEQINTASPRGSAKLTELVVLFASYNQRSTFVIEEPIVPTTVERLLRSYFGNVVFGNVDEQRYNVHTFQQLFAEFVPNKSTGLVLCLDELSKVLEISRAAHQAILDEVMSRCLTWLSQGYFVAVIGASISLYTIGDAVLTQSGRVLFPITFDQDDMSELEEAAREWLARNTNAVCVPSPSMKHHEFALRVALGVLKQSPRISDWSHIIKTSESASRPTVPILNYSLQNPLADDEFFDLIAEAAVTPGKLSTRHMKWLQSDRVLISYVVSQLHGSVKIDPGSVELEAGCLQNWERVTCSLRIPPWRLLQIRLGESGSHQSASPMSDRFSYVGDWAIAAVRDLFYSPPTDMNKFWEFAIMALLELYKTMMVRASDKIPTLRDLLTQLQAELVHACDAEAAAAEASTVKARHAYSALPQRSSASDTPTLYYSNKANEAGIEGVFCDMFKNVDVVFQMKLFTKAGPGKVTSWLNNARSCAQRLGYGAAGQKHCVLMLCVTGASEDNLKREMKRWPGNSIVLATTALEALCKPFGQGLIPTIVATKKRGRA